MAGKRKRNGGGSSSSGSSSGSSSVVSYVKPRSYKKARYSRGDRLYGARGGAGRGSSETKYVDGFANVGAILQMSIAADDTWAGTEFNARDVTGVYGSLPVPRQGVNYSNRDGRKIFQKKIRIRGEILWGANDSVTPPASGGLVRIIIVKDTRTNGVAMSGENAIGAGLGGDDGATTSGDGVGLQLMTNPDGWGRYVIMADEMFQCPPMGGAGTTADLNYTSQRTPFSFNIRCDCEVNFNGTTGVVGSVVDNSFHLLCAGNNSTVNPTVGYYARTSFTG